MEIFKNNTQATRPVAGAHMVESKHCGAWMELIPQSNPTLNIACKASQIFHGLI